MYLYKCLNLMTICFPEIFLIFLSVTPNLFNVHTSSLSVLFHLFYSLLTLRWVKKGKFRLYMWNWHASKSKQIQVSSIEYTTSNNLQRTRIEIVHDVENLTTLSSTPIQVQNAFTYQSWFPYCFNSIIIRYLCSEF